jgi:hypothetical protein
VFIGVLVTVAISVLALYHFRGKDFFMTFLSTAVLMLGLTVLTGLGEPSMYRFRSSVFFIMFALVLGGVLLEKFIWKLGRVLSRMDISPAPASRYFSFGRNRIRYIRYLVRDHERAMSGSLCVLFALLLTATPFFDPGYTHLGYEDCVEVTLDIVEEFPAEEVIIISGDFGNDREGRIIRGNGGGYMEFIAFNEMSAESKETGLQKYSFFIIEREPYPLGRDAFGEIVYSGELDEMQNILDSREPETSLVLDWLQESAADFGELSIYYRSDEITVYLLEKE